MTNRVIFAVGAHADDIEINIGGTVLKYLERSYKLIYVMSTNNMSGNWKRFKPNGERYTVLPPYTEIQPQRKLEAANAAKFYNDAQLIHLDHPQRHFTNAQGKQITVSYGCEKPHIVGDHQHTILTVHESAQAVQQVADLILEHKPEVVFTHGMVMVDMEHIGTCQLVSKGFRKAMEAGHDGVLAHWLDITPAAPIALYGRSLNRWDTHVDVSKQWLQKIESIRIHACQVPTPEHLEYPQWGPACGCEHAEVFTVPQWGKQPEFKAGLAFEMLQNMR